MWFIWPCDNTLFTYSLWGAPGRGAELLRGCGAVHVWSLSIGPVLTPLTRATRGQSQYGLTLPDTTQTPPRPTLRHQCQLTPPRHRPDTQTLRHCTGGSTTTPPLCVLYMAKSSMMCCMRHDHPHCEKTRRPPWPFWARRRAWLSRPLWPMVSQSSCFWCLSTSRAFQDPTA